MADEGLEHLPRGRQLVTIRRCGVLAEVGIVGLDHHAIAWMRRVRQHEVNVMVTLTFHACDGADDPVDTELFVADAPIPGRAALRRDGVQCSDRGVDHGVELNAGCRWIAEALHLSAVQRTPRC